MMLYGVGQVVGVSRPTSGWGVCDVSVTWRCSGDVAIYSGARGGGTCVGLDVCYFLGVTAVTETLILLMRL